MRSDQYIIDVVVTRIGSQGKITEKPAVRPAFACFIGNSDFEGTKNKRMFVEHTLDDKIMSIINRP